MKYKSQFGQPCQAASAIKQPCRKLPALLSAACLFLFLSATIFADSITVSESWNDSAVGGVYSSSTDSGTFNASLTVPGLSALSADEWANLQVSINSQLYTASDQSGSLGSFSDFMGDATSTGGTFSSTSATFFYQLTDSLGNLTNAFKITFSRSGNTLTITGQTITVATLNQLPGAPPWSILALDYYGLGSGIQDTKSCEIKVQGLTTFFEYVDVIQTLSVTGNDSVGSDSNGNELDTIRVNAAVNFAPPTVTAVSPPASFVDTNDLLNVQVKAADTNSPPGVEFFVNGSDYGPGISGASNLWSMMFALAPGTNLIQTLAYDTNNGSLSLPTTLSVTYVNRQTNANSISFSEHWLDSFQLGANDVGPSNVVSQDVGVLNAALAVPGLQNLPLAAWTNLLLSISFGNLSYSNSLAAADVLTSSNATFYLDPQSDFNGNPINLEWLTVSRQGNTLLLSVYTGNPTYFYTYDAFITDFYFGYGGPIQDTEPLALSLTDGLTSASYLNLSQSIFISGTDATNYDQFGDELDNIQVSGSADFVPPTNTITAPVTGQHWSNSVFTVTGKATDNEGVADVLVQVNGTGWNEATTGNNWTNWTAQVSLTPGTNTIQSYAVDTSGNYSQTNTVTLVYVLSAVLTVNVGTGGTVVTNYNGDLLQIGVTYSMTAKTNAGFTFTGWTGSIVTNKPTLVFQMASNLVFNANFADIAPPTNAITQPTANQHVSNAVFTVTGKAGDNAAVANVLVQVNGTGWNPATTGNNWSNWTAQVSLTPGTNIVQSYAVDTSGNLSATNTVSFVYVLSAFITVQVSPAAGGKVVTNYNGMLLPLGQTFSMTAKTNAGFAFTGWTGSLTTNQATLTFVMASNLVLTANFADIAKPTLAITAPANGQKMTNAVAYVTGTAADNWGVGSVWLQLNGQPWLLASTANAYTNWTATLTLVAGTNTLKAYAVDLAGNNSATNSVSLVSSNTFKLLLSFASVRPVNTNGLTFNLLLSTNLSGHIQYSTNLLNWLNLTNFVGTNTSLTFRDPAATNLLKRFYRAVIP